MVCKLEYNVGDIVRVRPDLPRRGKRDKTYINDNKWRLRGREIAIAHKYYDYDKQRWVYWTRFPDEYWTSGCFVPQFEEGPEMPITTEEWLGLI